jgi:mannosyltransferase
MARLNHAGEDSEQISLSSRLCFLFILALAAAVRFYGITRPYMWFDEAFSVQLSAYPPSLIWFHTGHDLHPPLYYLLLHVWMNMFGQGVLAVRALSVLAGVVTVALGVWLMRLIASTRVALLSGLLLAVFPVAVLFSQEARMYALLGVFLLGATLALVHWIKQPRQLRYLVFYALLMTLALYTHYYAVLCVLSHWLYLLVLRFSRPNEPHYINRLAWWMANTAIVLLYIPWLFSLVDMILHFKNVQAAGSISWLLEVTPYTLPSSIWAFLTLKKAHSLYWAVYWTLPLVVMAVAGWVTLRDRSRYQFFSLIGLYFFVPLLTLLVLSFVVPTFMERYVVFAALGLPMILAVAIVRLESRSRVLALGAVIAILGVQALGLTMNYRQQQDLDYPRNAELEPFDQVGHYIGQHASDGDRIIVDSKQLYFSTVYYNSSGLQPMLYAPSLIDEQGTSAKGYGALTLLSPHWDQIVLGSFALPAETRRVWWLTEPEKSENHPAFPSQWQQQNVLKAGNLQLMLFAICPMGSEASARLADDPCPT